MNNIQTDRLNLRYITTGDALFIRALFNEPAFLTNIGDRKIKHESDAIDYIVGNFIKSYEKYGYGPFAVELKKSSRPIGFCGFFKRDILRGCRIIFAGFPAGGVRVRLRWVARRYAA